MRHLVFLERAAGALVEAQLGPGRRIGIGGRSQLGRVAIELQLESALARIGEK
jgi:hypothetical protein